jgi:hypothetical protein
MKGKVTSRILLAAGLLFLGFNSAQAQFSWHLGVTGGPQYSMMSSNIGKYDGKIGFNAGLANELRFGPNFSIEIDNLISMAGGQRHYKDSLALYNGNTVMFNYNNSEDFMFLSNMLLVHYNLVLDGPIILPYDFEGPPKTWLTVFAGPTYNKVMGYNRSGTSTSYQRNDNNDTVVAETRINYQPNYIDTDRVKYISADEIGLVVGAGINFRLGKKNTLGFEARYFKGLTSMDKGYYGQMYIDPVRSATEGLLYRYADVFNSAISLNISYKWRIAGSKYE